MAQPRIRILIEKIAVSNRNQGVVLNTIPAIGPDTAIAPRTGSASPQSNPQQRADAAPSVLADSVATIADPGVMLKITPPVAARLANIDIPTHQLPGEVAKALADLQAVEGEMIKAVIGSAADADMAVAARLKQAIESLSPEIQEAIRQASSPEIARLLKLAAMTEAGIKEAPAYIRTGSAPLAENAADAAQRLLTAIREAPAFQLAGLVREALELSKGLTGNSQRLVQLAIAQAELHASQQGQEVLQGQAALPQGGPGASQLLEALLPEVFSNTQNPAGAADRGQGQIAASQLDSDAALAGGQTDDAAMDSDAQFLRAQTTNSSTVQASGTQQSAQLNGLAPGTTPPARNDLAASQMPVGMLITAPQIEEGLRDALRLLMDGRMIWNGQFTPNTPMSLERSDAWRANNKALGGMEKGTSLRIRFDLPNLGAVDIRALGFGGQVSVRVHAQSASTAAFAQALPALQARLKERGVAGAQVVVDSI